MDETRAAGPPVTVAIVEEHPLYRQALSRALGSDPRLLVVAAVDSPASLPSRLPRSPATATLRWPAVVLLDVHLPGMSGPAAIRRLTQHGCRVLVVTAARSRSQVLASFDAGARGYLTKAADAPAVVDAVHTVAGGGTVVDDAVTEHVVAAAGGRGSMPLTTRERQVVTLLATGRTDREIARDMAISTRTVHTHLDRIRTKTGIRRRTEMTRMAFEQGLASTGTL